MVERGEHPGGGPRSEVLARQEYSRTPPRSEYVLTDKGAELCDLLLVTNHWGDRWTADAAGPPVLHRHHTCGGISHVELHWSACDQPMSVRTIDVLPGPGREAVVTQA